MMSQICPSSCLYAFEDMRNEKHRGLIKSSNQKEYNHISAYSDNTIRVKCFAVFCANVFNGTVKELPYRIYDFITLGSIYRGIDEGRYQYQLKRYENYRNDICTPSFSYILAKNITYSIGKDLLQITTYPIYILARQVASLWGIFFPLDGMHMLGQLQEAWSLDSRFIQGLFFCTKEGCCLSEFFEKKLFFLFIAPCMLSNQFFKEKNIYPLLVQSDDHLYILRNLYLQAVNYQKKYTIYFENKLPSLDDRSIRMHIGNVGRQGNEKTIQKTKDYLQKMQKYMEQLVAEEDRLDAKNIAKISQSQTKFNQKIQKLQKKLNA